jgi:recombination protein RecT
VLVQHSFLKIDATLKELEAKRSDRNKPVIGWANINQNKLSTDVVHRAELGLDALIPGHIYPIPYLNGSTGRYDLDLRIGYVGKDLYKRCMALDPPEDIIYELVYSNDKFVPLKRSIKNSIESYEFEITEPFNRGEVIGGFAYVRCEDPKKNRLIIVTSADFKKSQSKAKSQDFWSAYPDEMKYKTLVNRATNKLTVDPKKVNSAYISVEQEENAIDVESVRMEIAENGNKGPVLEIEAGKAVETETVTGDAQPETEEQAPAPEVKRGPSF